MKYILYCRKSTDTEDKQVQSLDSQEHELLDMAKKHNLLVVKVLKESMSAKSAGRPIFERMMKMIDSGKADAILCWKLDRLARNFVDGGKIIDNLQKSIIKEIRTYEAIHLPSDNVLLLAVQLGMANQYIRDLSVNVKRGNREKLARGEWPNHAPFGYLNDKATKSIIVDPVRSKYVIRAFELYITGSHGHKEISDILYQEGLRTRTGRKVLKSHMQRILSSVFYTGLMERDGKYYEGKHQPLISKETFEKAKDVMSGRSRPRPQRLFFPLRGFLKCENCGCALTASLHKGHHYYYCTGNRENCDEHKSYMREIYLYEKVSGILDSLAFSERKIELMYEAAKKMADSDDGYSKHILETFQTELESLKTKESLLVDTFLSEQITKELYDAKMLALHNQRISLTKQIKETETKQPACVLEPTKKVFLEASRAKKEFLDGDDFKKRNILENLCWNLSIKEKNIHKVSLRTPFDIMLKAPKNGDISTLLRARDSNPNSLLQREESYH